MVPLFILKLATPGHDLIAATISIPMPSVPLTEFRFRDFKNLNARGHCEYLRESDWSIFDSQPTLEQALSTLYENLFKAIDTHVYIKVVNTSKRKHPWFTSEHHNMIKERDRLYRRFDLTRHHADLMFYRALRDATHQSIENARLDYYANRLCVISDSKELWKELDHLGLTSKSTPHVPVFSAEELNAHFANISTDQNAPSTSEFLDSLPLGDPPDAFRFSEISLSDITQEINKSSSQARGADEVPQSICSATLPVIAPYLHYIFNASLREASFPDIWKMSLIVAINKIKSPTRPGDYRPISLLCYLSKVMEKLVSVQVKTFIEKKG